MKTIFYNGKIYITKDKFATAFVVEDKIITKVYFDNNFNLDDYNTKHNLNGKVVLPGLIDNHNHFLLSTKNDEKFDFNNIKTKWNLINDLILYKQVHFNLNMIYLEGLKINEKMKSLNRTDLDKISNDIPIILFSHDRHSAYLNTNALTKLNLFYPYPICKEKVVELDENGLPTGIIKENACSIVRKFVNDKNQNLNFKKMLKVQKEIINYGISTIATCDIVDVSFNNDIKIYESFVEKQKLNIIHQFSIIEAYKIESYIRKIKKHVEKNNFQIKVFIDGSISSKTAALTENYLGDLGNFGFLNYDYNTLKTLVEIANKKNVQVIAHCIGDRATCLCLKVYSDIDPKNEIRNGFIHCQITCDWLIKLLKKNNTYISVQPCFIEDDLNIVEKYLNPTLLEKSYSYKTLKDNGINISFSSDAPVCSFNPWLNMYYALTNTQLKKPNKQWKQSENFSIQEAIDAYTYQAAIFLKKEHEIGMIDVGYYANFIVIDKDIFNLKDPKEILDVKVLNNYIYGEECIE